LLELYLRRGEKWQKLAQTLQNVLDTGLSVQKKKTRIGDA